MDKKILRRGVLRIVLAVLLLAISAVFLWYNGQEKEPDVTGFSVEVIPPTCTGGGYSMYTDPDSGQVVMKDIVPATGHSYGPWQEDVPAQLTVAGSRSCICATCGEKKTERTYVDMGIAVIGLDGSLDGIAKKVEVPMEASFHSEEMEFTSYATLKYQGHSSLEYPKKNYTLKFWKDSQTTEKNKVTFSHWNKENKYILKADYLDPTMCRNLICADVWAEVTASRDDLPEAFAELSNYGAVDGFPAALYINGEFQGLYNMNLHKDDDLFGMSDEASHAIVINNAPVSPAAYFQELADFAENEPWEVEFCDTEDNQWAKDKLNELITFVMESDDATFRAELGNYLNVDSAIDYLLSVYVLGLTNHGADELILVCYDKDEPWTASLYDMETGFGLSADGKTFLPADQFLPRQTNGVWDSGTQNLLWDRLLQNFYPELQQRYSDLRQSVFTAEALIGRVEEFTGNVPQALYEANNRFHKGYPDAADGLEQIRAYIQGRIQQIDKLFL